MADKRGYAREWTKELRSPMRTFSLTRIRPLQRRSMQHLSFDSQACGELNADLRTDRHGRGRSRRGSRCPRKGLGVVRETSCGRRSASGAPTQNAVISTYVAPHE